MDEPKETASEASDEERQDGGIPLIPGFTGLTRIGRGGFSVVYAGVESSLHRRVAIKVINGDDGAAARLEREVRALGMLDDVPNVVSAHSIVRTTGGQLALIMPLFSRSLSQYVKVQGGQPVEVVCEWSRQLARCLDQAHIRGIVHRDVKPENVLLDDSNSAHLADFGIAAMESFVSRTATVMSISPPHAPPERLNGLESGGVRGDIYSLASTVYFAATGRPPFGTTSTGGAAGLILRIVNDPVPHDDNLSTAMLAVFARAMAKDQADRFPTASAFAEALAASAKVPPVFDLLGTVPRSDKIVLDTGTVLGADAGTIDEPSDLTRVRIPPRQAQPVDTGADVNRPTGVARSSPPVVTDSPLGGRQPVDPPPAEQQLPERQPARFGSDPNDRIRDVNSVDLARSDGQRSRKTRSRVAAGVLALVVLALIGAGVIYQTRPWAGSDTAAEPGLRLRVFDSTDGKPLPEGFGVSINGQVLVIDFDDRWARVVAPDAFATGQQARIEVQLEEHFVFEVDRKGKIKDGNRVGELAITDDWVGWEGDKRARFPTANPSDPDAETDPGQPITDGDLVAVATTIQGAFDETAKIDKQFDALWEGSGPVPYEEIQDVVENQITPGYAALIEGLRSVESKDPKGRAALEATEKCLADKVRAFESEGQQDPAKDEAANLDVRSQLWDTAKASCSDSSAKLQALGVA